MTRVAAGTNSFHDTVSIDSEETLDESAIGGPVSLSACVLNIETDSTKIMFAFWSAGQV